MPTCSVADCEKPPRSRGWCNAHYQAWWKYGDPLTVAPARWDGYVRPQCSVDGCAEVAHARGMCSSHFCRARRHGDPLAGRRPNATGTTEERFWSFVDLPDDPHGCWLWNGGCFAAGYSQFTADGEQVYGHRWSHAHFIGPIPDGLELDHLCRNPPCVNPAHLEAVTQEENVRRARKTHCPRGHPYDETNTYVRPDGYRDCKRCINRRSRERNARRRAAA